ncbi:MAG TPA: heme-binding protein [Acetobacteraceae bacterium]|nr:heme-binding protein [Acetobacteraceae bacterium]
MIRPVLLVLAMAALAASAASAQTIEKKALSLAAAKKVAAAAEAEAMKNKFTMSIAVIDDGGFVVYQETMDETQHGSVGTALAKARSALFYKRPTKAFEEALASGRTGLLALPDAMPIEGGVPLSVEGKVIGAIGVSGGTSAQDGQIAQVGAGALQ